MFCFGGRRANLELQLPFIYRILEEYPDVEYHLWNLAQNYQDDQFIRSLPSDGRFVVQNQFAGNRPWDRFDDVYRFYTDPQFQQDSFIKMDDDIVFIETERFDLFQRAARDSTDCVSSAKVVNNGACVKHWADMYQKFRTLRMPLLDVHLHPKFAFAVHEMFLKNTGVYLHEDPRVIRTEDWLSINFIGYSYEMGCRMAFLLGTQSPRHIAGRHFSKPHARLGDEGMVNTLPRVIMEGFTVSHLTFGPQERRSRPAIWDELRTRYAQVNKEYLS